MPASADLKVIEFMVIGRSLCFSCKIHKTFYERFESKKLIFAVKFFHEPRKYRKTVMETFIS